MPGDVFIDKYFGFRKINRSGAAGRAGATPSLADFVRFAAATAERRNGSDR
jgi:hypothetical protein